MRVVVDDVAEDEDDSYPCPWRYSGSHLMQLVGMVGIGTGSTKRVLIFTLFLFNGEPEVTASKFLKLAAESGAFLLSPEWMNRLGVRKFDGPAALWLTFLLRDAPAVIGPHGPEMNNLYGRSVLAITKTVASLAVKTEAVAVRRKGSRRRRTRSNRPLTELQRQALELYGTHNGKIIDIANAMNISHSTVHDHLKAVWKKMPDLAPKKTKAAGRTRSIPADRRGQATI